MSFGISTREDGRQIKLVFPLSFKREQKRIIGYKGGSRSDFAWLYKKYHRPILNYVFEKTRDAHVAEELTQEVFLKVFRFRESYQPQYRFSTWLWTIARNTVLDWLRKGSNASVESGGEDSVCDLEQLPDHGPSPERLLSEDCEKEELLKIMHSLTDLQKEALILRIIHRLSYQEISKRLDLSLASVKGLIHRAKSAITKGLMEKIPIRHEREERESLVHGAGR